MSEQVTGAQATIQSCSSCAHTERGALFKGDPINGFTDLSDHS